VHLGVHLEVHLGEGLKRVSKGLRKYDKV
jgi:hypothetical protein